MNELDGVLREVRETRGKQLALFLSFSQELNISDINRYLEILLFLDDQKIILDELSKKQDDSSTLNSIHTETNHINKLIVRIIQSLKARTFQYLDSIKDDILSNIITVVSLNNTDSKYNDFLIAIITEKHVRANKKTNKISYWISVIAIALSAFSFLVSAYFSYTANKTSGEWQTTQTTILKEIKDIIPVSVE